MAVTPETIAVALARTAPAFDSAEYAAWDLWIADATRAVERRAERLGVDMTTLDAQDVDYVVREAVVDHVRHPDDATQVAVSVDDAQVSRTYRSARGRVTILPEWWDLLFPTTVSRRAYEMDMMPNPTVLR